MRVQETNEIRELTTAEADAVGGGRTDIIKAMGNTSWDDGSKWPTPLILWFLGDQARNV